MDKFSFDSLLGRGSFARVHLATKRKSKKRFAIKTMKKDMLFQKGRNLDCVIKEIEVQRMLDHPNVIKLYEVYESDLYLHLVLEYIKGGDLLGYINNKGTYNEKDASLLAFKILTVLEYCHELNIIHRDLKLENLMIM